MMRLRLRLTVMSLSLAVVDDGFDWFKLNKSDVFLLLLSVSKLNILKFRVFLDFVIVEIVLENHLEYRSFLINR